MAYVEQVRKDNTTYEITPLSTAPRYNASNTYDVGDYCYYDGILYRCKTAITTAEAWTASHWDATTVNEELNGIYDGIDDIVIISEQQPSVETNKIWIEDNDDYIEIPTMDDLDELSEDITDLQDALDGKVDDVQVNGTSVVSQGVAEIPLASDTAKGVVGIDSYYGVGIGGVTQALLIACSTSAQVKAGTNQYRPIVPKTQHESTFYGLAKAASDTTQSASSNAVGTYTETALSKISDMLNAPVTVSGTTPSITAMSGVRYICGEVATLSITAPASGCCDVVFESGSTPTVLTVPNTVKWANGFDPTSLDANTTYEINIMDGLGVAMSWT